MRSDATTPEASVPVLSIVDALYADLPEIYGLLDAARLTREGVAENVSGFVAAGQFRSQTCASSVVMVLALQEGQPRMEV
jgi:hypothetical protein